MITITYRVDTNIPVDDEKDWTPDGTINRNQVFYVEITGKDFHDCQNQIKSFVDDLNIWQKGKDWTFGLKTECVA
jgi:hypothetical protein